MATELPAEPQPRLKLQPQEKPHQKISISHMPASLYKALERRARRVLKTVPNYCRVVLEHALEHKADYTGPLSEEHADGNSHEKAVHIPILNKKFMRELHDWDPYGLNQKTLIALSVLRRHLEVRTW
jgi:hypothetical protein